MKVKHDTNILATVGNVQTKEQNIKQVHPEVKRRRLLFTAVSCEAGVTVQVTVLRLVIVSFRPRSKYVCLVVAQ